MIPRLNRSTVNPTWIERHYHSPDFQSISITSAPGQTPFHIIEPSITSAVRRSPRGSDTRRLLAIPARPTYRALAVALWKHPI